MYRVCVSLLYVIDPGSTGSRDRDGLGNGAVTFTTHLLFDLLEKPESN
jgi:hypothetical protein